MANKSQQANRTIHKTGILPTTGGIRYTSSLKQCVEYQKWDMIWWLFKQNLNKISGIYTSGDLHCILCSPALTGGVIIKAFTALLFFPSGSLFYSRVLSSTVIFVFVFFHSTKTLSSHRTDLQPLSNATTWRVFLDLLWTEIVPPKFEWYI